MKLNRFSSIVVKSILVFLCIQNFSNYSLASSASGELEKARELEEQLEKLYKLERFADAIPLAKQMLIIREKDLGPEHPDVADSLSDLAILYIRLSQYNKALPFYERALAIREKKLGLDHPELLLSLNNLATCYSKMGAYNKAEPLLRRALTIRENRLGLDHPYAATSLNNLAFVYDKLGAYAKAEPLYKRAVEIAEKKLGSEHPSLAINLANLAGLYIKMGNFKNAEPLANRALEIKEKAYGSEHPSVANSLVILASLYTEMGVYTKAKPLYQRALKIRETALGPEHPNVAKSLVDIALLYHKMGDYSEVEPLYRRALDIFEKALGREHPDIAINLVDLASFYDKIGKYTKAEPQYNRALDILTKEFGPDHPHVADSLCSLASHFEIRGDYVKAESLSKNALAIYEEKLGPEHPNVATSLNLLASLYYKMGAGAKAEPLYIRALSIREKALGPEHPSVATSINNLAVLYSDMGSYAKAESMYQSALMTSEKVLGPEHPSVATNLNNLALLYYKLGSYAKAEPLYKRALAITEKVLGSEHPSVATNIDNIACLYSTMGDYAKAEPLCKRALTIREKTIGYKHPHVAINLSNLALIYTYIGDYEKAELMCKRALAIDEKSLGSEHPMVATSLNNLALLYAYKGEYAKAESHYMRAIAINEKAYVPNHPNVATGLSNLAFLKAAQESYQEAFSLFMQSLAIDKKTIDHVMGFAFEKQKMAFLAKMRGNLFGLLSLVVNHMPSDPKAQKAAFDIWINRKGMVLEAQSRFQEVLVYSDDPQTLQVLQQLAQIRSRLSKLVFADPGKIGNGVYRKRIAELETEKQQLEAKLSRLSQAYALKKKIDRTDSRKIAAQLPEGTVLLDFALVKMFDFKARGKEKKWLPARYIVFVLHAGSGERLAMIDLGSAEKIDKCIENFKIRLKEAKDFLDGAEDLSENNRLLERSAQRLYTLVFGPITEALDGARELYISPDGNLNLIPFEVLQNLNGRYLIEDYTFNYLVASRDVLGFGLNKGKAGKSVIIGDPDFDLGSESSSDNAPTAPDLAPSRAAHRSIQMADLHFERLPDTQKEAAAIRNILGEKKAALYMDKEAVEAALFGNKAPRILHLATHGFFLSDQDLGALADKNAMTSISAPSTTKRNTVPIENPLLRSGIALAGANTTLKHQGSQKSDGIITAEKILGLKLRGTEMVVLSACQTGVGKVQSGEGVFGLRRAFVQAGTRSLVMSMWAVPDKETRELMVRFYQNIDSGMKRNQALRQAVLKQMRISQERHGHAHPLYWGAFVFLGES